MYCFPDSFEYTNIFSFTMEKIDSEFEKKKKLYGYESPWEEWNKASSWENGGWVRISVTDFTSVLFILS